MTNVYDVLKERGFIEQETSPELREAFEKPVSLYLGIDPSANCIHLGNHMGIMPLRHLIRYGHQVYLLIGGATGHIGDPSGKSNERPELSTEEIMRNVAGLRKVIEPLLNVPGGKPPIFVNNLDWFGKMSMIEYLRDVGKAFRMGPMIAKDSVRTRLNSKEGMSFTEFSYQTLQGYDFYYLNREHGVTMQIGGSDQWGNITAGIDCTRKKSGANVGGFTFPLLTTSDGRKFGKTEEGALWLDATLCSPYLLYQHLYKIPDVDVIRMMKFLTEMDLSEIQQHEEAMKRDDYVPNSAQKKMAEEIIRIVHGEAGLQEALKGSKAMTFGKGEKLDPEALLAAMEELPSIEVKKGDVFGISLTEVMVQSKMVSSKSEARRLIKQGAISLNQEKISDENRKIMQTDLLKGDVFLIRAGKKKSLVVKCS